MKDSTKVILGAIAGLVVGVLAVLAFGHRNIVVNITPQDLEQKAGTGSIFGRQDTQKADVVFITGSSSTPATSASLLCAMTNDDADHTDRYIDGIDVYIEDTSSTWVGASRLLTIATSTSATATTTPFNGIQGPTAFSTTTNLQRYTSSTSTVTTNRRHRYNDSILVFVQPSVSSTGGSCIERYTKSPTMTKY